MNFFFFLNGSSYLVGEFWFCSNEFLIISSEFNSFSQHFSSFLLPENLHRFIHRSYIPGYSAYTEFYGRFFIKKVHMGKMRWSCMKNCAFYCASDKMNSIYLVRSNPINTRNYEHLFRLRAPLTMFLLIVNSRRKNDAQFFFTFVV